MECSRCEMTMKLETQMKESGFWFLWYSCTNCGEGFLHKSSLPADVSFKNPSQKQNKFV